MYLVYTGTLSAIKYTQNGHEIFLSEIRVGELVGELSILAGTERSSAVIATSNAVLVSLDAKRFDLFCTDYPVLGKAVMSQLAERLIRTSTVLSERISMSVPSRLYGELVRAGASSAEDDEILVVRPIPSVTGLARKIHATREATSRAMTSLQSRGLVRRTDALLEIVTPKN
ncbi:MAG: Crp/Fnr family transcriptional regulator [Pseudomonadota bacterium]